MKRTLLLVTTVTLLAANESVAQMTTAPASQINSNQNHTETLSGIKPADGKPYVFSSKEELDRSVVEKVKGLRDQILSGKLTEAQITELREQIWRFENATVAK